MNHRCLLDKAFKDFSCPHTPSCSKLLLKRFFERLSLRSLLNNLWTPLVCPMDESSKLQADIHTLYPDNNPCLCYQQPHSLRHQFIQCFKQYLDTSVYCEDAKCLSNVLPPSTWTWFSLCSGSSDEGEAKDELKPTIKQPGLDLPVHRMIIIRGRETLCSWSAALCHYTEQSQEKVRKVEPERQ